MSHQHFSLRPRVLLNTLNSTQEQHLPPVKCSRFALRLSSDRLGRCVRLGGASALQTTSGRQTRFLTFTLGHLAVQSPYPLYPRKADMCGAMSNACFGPKADIAPPHSITLSARVSSCLGTVSPIAFAVLALITSSKLVGCITGKSATNRTERFVRGSDSWDLGWNTPLSGTEFQEP